MQHLEIEFKNLLTKAEYNHLLQHFNIQRDQIIPQANHYFETPEGHLKRAMSGLRIRQIGDYYECTLKEKSSTNAHLETNVEITKEQAEEVLATGCFPFPEISTRLKAINVPLDQLSLFGSLETDRVEFPFKEGLLVLDHSKYLQQEDYEVEYETSDEKLGAISFNQLLEAHKIPKRQTDKKIARFMNALKENK